MALTRAGRGTGILAMTLAHSPERPLSDGTMRRPKLALKGHELDRLEKAERGRRPRLAAVF